MEGTQAQRGVGTCPGSHSFQWQGQARGEDACLPGQTQGQSRGKGGAASLEREGLRTSPAQPPRRGWMFSPKFQPLESDPF